MSSEDLRDLYYHQHGTSSTTNFPNLNHTNSSFFTYNNINTNNNRVGCIIGDDPSSSTHDIQNPSSYVSFMSECLQGSSDYNTLERAFGLGASATSPDQPFSVVKDEQKPVLVEGLGSGETPVTPYSSISSSSTEAGGDEDSNKGKKDKHGKETLDDGGESSNMKENKQNKKKAEKKQKQPRFAFMTKSEVDHLEDGYRWRKYGQKAVKNSPYPRSYYRCTTQKCTVKKRVERSFQDPSIVITTYEGQHNHLLPTNLRGTVAGLLPPSMLGPPPPLMAALPGGNFPQELMLQMPHHHHQHMLYSHGSTTINNPMYQQMLTPLHQQLQFSDFGLLQEVFPPMFLKQEP